MHCQANSDVDAEQEYVYILIGGINLLSTSVSCINFFGSNL